MEVARTDAVGDDGAHRSFVVPLPLAHPGPGWLGQARRVPVGDQRLAAVGGVRRSTHAAKSLGKKGTVIVDLVPRPYD